MRSRPLLLFLVVTKEVPEHFELGQSQPSSDHRLRDHIAGRRRFVFESTGQDVGYPIERELQTHHPSLLGIPLEELDLNRLAQSILQLDGLGLMLSLAVAFT